MENETEKRMNEPIYSSTAYDDAFRTMESECDDILIGLVNYFFNENYDEKAKVKRMRNEHFVEHEDNSEDKRVTDSHFIIQSGNVSKRYHLECESSRYDGTILVRVFEYNAQIALDTAEIGLSELHIKFPYTGLLLLRETTKAPKTAKIIIDTPGGSATYDVPIVKESDFTIDAIFEKRLYILIPFFIFNFESNLKEINEDDTKSDELASFYSKLLDRLEEEQKKGRLSELSYSVIIKLTNSVMYKLSMKNENIQRKVGDVMGGKVIDLPEIRAYHQGIDKGLAEGRAEGRAEGIATGIAQTEEKYKDVALENERLRKEVEELRQLCASK